MGKHVLVAPGLDHKIDYVTWNTQGKPPQSEHGGEGKLLVPGDAIYEQHAVNYKAKPFLVDLFTRHAKVDLSIRALSHGVYRTTGLHHVNVSDYGLPSSLSDIREGKGIYAFTAIVEGQGDITGERLYARYFNALEQNRQELTRALKDYVRVGISEFWDNLSSERKRLKHIDCPIFPHDGSPLFER